METIGPEAIRLYSERKKLIDQRKELAPKVLEKGLSRRGQARQRFVDGLEAKSGPIDEATKYKMLLGRKLGSQIIKNTEALETNLNNSVAHYEDHADSYHQEAIDNAAEKGIQVDFSGDVAVNVNPKPFIRPPVTSETTSQK